MTNQNLIKYSLPGLMLITFLLGLLTFLQKMTIRWDSGDNSYCYLILPLFIYLCWEKKDSFRFGEFTWNIWGLFPVVMSILLIFAGELGSIETFVYIGLWGCIIGTMVTIYGTRLFQLWFPLLILVFIIPLPPFINRMMTFHLKLAASSLSVAMLRLVGISVLQDGNIIDLGIAQLQVVDACSGLRYLMPLILMALLFGYFYCQWWWQNAILLIAVIPLSIVVNGMRIILTGMLHVWGKPELAEDFFHDFSGWIVFMLAGAILFGSSILLRRMGNRLKKVEGIRSTVEAKSLNSGERKVIGGQEEQRGRNTAPNDLNAPKPSNPLKKSLTITAVLCLLFLGSGYSLKRLPSAANLPARTSFETFPMEIGNWQAKRNYLSQEILENLWSDDYLNATYINGDRSHAINLLIPFYEYQGTRHTAHAPQSCMLGGGWALISSKERFVTTDDGTRFPIMASMWEKGETRVLGSYFFFQRGRTITSPWMNKYWLMVDAFTRQRTDGALVRAEMPIPSHQSAEDSYRMLEGFLGLVYEILPEYVPI
ncbi:eight transmembrane protein EpsH [Desulfosarcina variabilis str. Montpellier]|uniref:VPLPA-CTERM-specific exosortase XrtD n=1 Tax=Desulfosarcina variabilis TaxID=2300 RepID=UPI003AFAD0FB